MPDTIKPDFLETLKELRHGTTMTDLAEEMQKVVKAVRETGGKGSLTFTLKVRPLTDSPALVVSDDIKVKLPTTKAGDTILFSDAQHRLTNKDPRQPELDGLGGLRVTASLHTMPRRDSEDEAEDNERELGELGEGV